jgi:uncharacterized BrkB/YihY/UPF0761 family membrane protein
MQNTALNQTDLMAKRFIYYYAGFLTFITMVYIFCVTFATIPAGNQRIVDVVLGFLLGTVLATIMQFFFGTSVGSLAKNKMLEIKDQLIGKLKNGG